MGCDSGLEGTRGLDELVIENDDLKRKLAATIRERDVYKGQVENLLKEAQARPGRFMLEAMLKDTRSQLQDLQRLHDFAGFEQFHRDRNSDRAKRERGRVGSS